MPDRRWQAACFSLDLCFHLKGEKAFMNFVSCKVRRFDLRSSSKVSDEPGAHVMLCHSFVPGQGSHCPQLTPWAAALSQSMLSSSFPVWYVGSLLLFANWVDLRSTPRRDPPPIL
ncbi:UNVERIFIED_CONTAM: hypothetical protein K2H54_014194 [Gekko kuhli]